MPGERPRAGGRKALVEPARPLTKLRSSVTSRTCTAGFERGTDCESHPPAGRIDDFGAGYCASSAAGLLSGNSASMKPKRVMSVMRCG